MNLHDYTIRPYTASDRDFVLSLASTLAEVAGLTWHTDETILKFQKNYIEKHLEKDDTVSATFVAEQQNTQLGFIHVCDHRDEISDEACATVPLLAVLPNAQKLGIGKELMLRAQSWANDRNYRLLHLEVFYKNKKGIAFYRGLGFQPDTVVMVKEL